MKELYFNDDLIQPKYKLKVLKNIERIQEDFENFPKFRDHLIEEKTIQKNALRQNIKKGSKVKIVLKKDQGTDKLVTGTVSLVLTSKPVHTRGIKVKLMTGEVGRVQEIIK